MADDRPLNPRVARALSAGVAVSGLLLALGLVLPPPYGPKVINAGIAVLVATPVGRVLLLTYGHARRGESGLMWAGLSVLAMLVLSALLGRVHG